MGKLNLLVSIFIFCLAQKAQSQVLFVQWSDVHSALKSFTQQILAIDNSAQDFLMRNPKGEVVIVVNGDFTSINPMNIKEGGWISMDGLKLLKQRGYTLLFIPGNHDAFDWTVRINGADLFLEQMKALKEAGVTILAENFIGKNPEFQKITSPSYRLKTLKAPSHIVGLTLPTLMSKSNLSEENASRLFTGIETYHESMDRILPKMAQNGVSNIFWSIHQGHMKLQRQVLRIINETLVRHSINVKTPLMMGGHDHQVASYRTRGTHISDGGSHGSMNIIEVDELGRISQKNFRHIGISEDSLNQIKPESFQWGQKYLNSISEAEILQQDWLKPFHQRVSNLVSTSEKRLARVLGQTRGIDLHKAHLKQGPNELGNLIAESLVSWAKTLGIIQKNTTPIIAMINSSSYRLEAPIPAGEMTEFVFRNMYPFNNEATLYYLSGQEIKDLYFSLRRVYSNSDKTLFSPHLNYDAKEVNGDLLIKENGQWNKIDTKNSYWIVIDGWLSDHRFEQSYRIKEWLEILSRNRPRATRPYQDVLVKFMPPLIENHEQLGPRPLQCRFAFQLVLN